MSTFQHYSQVKRSKRKKGGEEEDFDEDEEDEDDEVRLLGNACGEPWATRMQSLRVETAGYSITKSYQYMAN